jgi:hypothetical protein
MLLSLNMNVPISIENFLRKLLQKSQFDVHVCLCVLELTETIVALSVWQHYRQTTFELFSKTILSNKGWKEGREKSFHSRITFLIFICIKPKIIDLWNPLDPFYDISLSPMCVCVIGFLWWIYIINDERYKILLLVTCLHLCFVQHLVLQTSGITLLCHGLWQCTLVC